MVVEGVEVGRRADARMSGGGRALDVAGELLRVAALHLEIHRVDLAVSLGGHVGWERSQRREKGG